MYSELNFQNPVTDVHYHPRDHMVAFCSLGENHPVLIYDYDVASKYLSLRLSCHCLFFKYIERGYMSYSTTYTFIQKHTLKHPYLTYTMYTQTPILNLYNVYTNTYT